MKDDQDRRLAAAEDRIFEEAARRLQNDEEEEKRNGDVELEEAAREEVGAMNEQVEQAEVEENANDDMIGLLTRGMPPDTAKDFVNVYELLLIHGAKVGDAKAKFCELFSPPGVAAAMQWLPVFNLVTRSTFDLRMDERGCRWNFVLEADRKRARRRIAKEKPYIVIGGPPCNDFTILTKINSSRIDPGEVRKRRAEAQVLLDFTMKIYEMQLRGGRHFVHEHPRSASR